MTSTHQPPAAKTPTPAPDKSARRFRRRRLSRRWRAVRRLLLAVLGVVLVVGGVWLVFFSSVLAVKGSAITGTSVLSRQQVQAAAAVPLGVPLATADLDAIRARVEDLAPVESAEVSRSWPDRIRIAVTERTAVAAVQWEGTWRGFDSDGVLFRTYPKRPAGLPEARVRASTTVDALAESAHVLSVLPAEVTPRLAYLSVRSIDGITLHLKDGTVIEWGSSDQSDLKAEVLSLLMAKQKASVYNVTAPGRPTMRP